MGKYIVSGSGYSLTFSLASNRDLAHGYGGYGLLRPQGPYIYVSIWLEWVILIEYLGRPEDWAFYEGESFYFCLGGLELNFTGCTLEQIYVCMAMREERTLAAWWRLMPNCLGIDTLYWPRMATTVDANLCSMPNAVKFRLLRMTRTGSSVSRTLTEYWTHGWGNRSYAGKGLRDAHWGIYIEENRVQLKDIRLMIWARTCFSSSTSTWHSFSYVRPDTWRIGKFNKDMQLNLYSPEYLGLHNWRTKFAIANTQITFV